MLALLVVVFSAVSCGIKAMSTISHLAGSSTPASSQPNYPTSQPTTAPSAPHSTPGDQGASGTGGDTSGGPQTFTGVMGSFDQPIDVDGIRVTMTNARQLQPPQGTRGPSNGMFIGVDFTMVNNSGGVMTFRPSVVTLHDGLATFKPDYSLAQAIPNLVDNATVNPGDSLSGTVVFDVPVEVVNSSDAELWVSPVIDNSPTPSFGVVPLLS